MKKLKDDRPDFQTTDGPVLGSFTRGAFYREEQIPPAYADWFEDIPEPEQASKKSRKAAEPPAEEVTANA